MYCPAKVRITLKELQIKMRIAAADVPVRIPKSVVRIHVRNARMRTIPEITEAEAASVKPYMRPDYIDIFFVVIMLYKKYLITN